jgi:hypothetical protein
VTVVASPYNRPSEVKDLPKVWPAQVRLSFSATDAAWKYRTLIVLEGRAVPFKLMVAWYVLAPVGSST